MITYKYKEKYFFLTGIGLKSVCVSSHASKLDILQVMKTYVIDSKHLYRHSPQAESKEQ